MVNNTPINKPADTANSVIQFSIMKLLLNFVVIDLQTSFPFLKLPVISQLFSYLMGLLLDPISKRAQTFVTFIIIDLQVSKERTDYQAAEKELHDAINSKDIQKIIDAKSKFDGALRAAVKFDGVAVPK